MTQTTITPKEMVAFLDAELDDETWIGTAKNMFQAMRDFIAAKSVPERRRHEWQTSQLGHGDMMCKHCYCTSAEARFISPEFCPND